MQKTLEFLNAAPWIFAKSMPKIPHWYVNRFKMPEELDNDFMHVCNYVQSNGKHEMFYRKVMTYLYVGDWKVWTMGCPVKDRKTTEFNKDKFTWILNIAQVDGLGPEIVDPNKGIKEGKPDESYNRDWAS